MYRESRQQTHQNWTLKFSLSLPIGEWDDAENNSDHVSMLFNIFRPLNVECLDCRISWVGISLLWEIWFHSIRQLPHEKSYNVAVIASARPHIGCRARYNACLTASPMRCPHKSSQSAFLIPRYAFHIPPCVSSVP